MPTVLTVSNSGDSLLPRDAFLHHRPRLSEPARDPFCFDPRVSASIRELTEKELHQYSSRQQREGHVRSESIKVSSGSGRCFLVILATLEPGFSLRNQTVCRFI